MSAPSHTIASVIAFNQTCKEIYSNPDSTTGVYLLCDISGSISGSNALLLRTAIATMTYGTSAHGQFVIPKPNGQTGIISGVKHCQGHTNCRTIYIFTDGHENCYSGPLEIGIADDGTPKVLDVSFTSGKQGILGTPQLLADFLQVSGVKICLLGIGNAAKPMVDEMLNRKNVFCGYIDHAADTKAIVSVVRTLQHVSSGETTSVTRNGTQHAVIVSNLDDVQKVIQDMTMAEIREFDTAVGSTLILGEAVVTVHDLKHRLRIVFETYDEPIFPEQLRYMMAALLLGMELMCDGATPGAIITSKYSAIIGIPRGWRGFRRHCNRLWGHLVKAGLLQRASPVPPEGRVVWVDTKKYTFAAGCPQYECTTLKPIIYELAQDAGYCTPRDSLTSPTKNRKRKTSGDHTVQRKYARIM